VGTIYGNCLLDSNKLREFRGGLLKDSSTNLPLDVGSDDEKSAGFCSILQKKYYPQEKVHCFKSGDTYVNNNPYKTAVVVALMRQHNRVARNLARVNPGWDDERLFQETRKILGAIMEVITYQEFLPAILSPETMKSYRLEVLPDDQFTEYDSNLNPSTSAEFTAVAMRSIGHSMINGDTSMVFFDGRKESYPLKDYFFYEQALHDGFYDALVKGSVIEPSNKPDIYMDHVARNLFQKVHTPYGPPYGNDISTIDIMRGRDYGVASYLTFRKYCDDSFKMTDSFESLISDGIITQENVVKLSKVYQTPRDIDLYTGMLIEEPVEGSMVGPTANCIWGREFYRKKFGDRYYFEHGSQAGSFTKRQLMTLKKVTLAKILCENGDGYRHEKIQRMAMLLPDKKGNPEVECSSLPDLDWMAWTPISEITKPQSFWTSFVNGFNKAFNISRKVERLNNNQHGYQSTVKR
jgi:peroxidase